MNATLTYREPYRFSAGMLALTVHLLFFFFLYFGFRWQSQPQEAFMVEMWENLPAPEIVPEPEPVPPAVAEPAPPPKVVEPVLPPVKAEIEVRDPKSRKAEKKEKQTKKEKEKAMAAAREKLEKEKELAAAAARADKEKEQRELDAYVARRKQAEQERKQAEQERIQAEQERVRAEVEAAMAAQVGRYQDMIRSKIRLNIVKQDVPDTAAAEFRVTLLPDGSVLDVKLLKSSGYEAYDNATERAIYRAQPLPMPADAGLQKMFRELRLTIRP